MSHVPTMLKSDGLALQKCFPAETMDADVTQCEADITGKENCSELVIPSQIS